MSPGCSRRGSGCSFLGSRNVNKEVLNLGEYRLSRPGPESARWCVAQTPAARLIGAQRKGSRGGCTASPWLREPSGGRRTGRVALQSAVRGNPLAQPGAGQRRQRVRSWRDAEPAGRNQRPRRRHDRCSPGPGTGHNGWIAGTGRRPAAFARHGSIHRTGGRGHQHVCLPTCGGMGPGVPGQGRPQRSGETVRPGLEPAVVDGGRIPIGAHGRPGRHQWSHFETRGWRWPKVVVADMTPMVFLGHDEEGFGWNAGCNEGHARPTILERIRWTARHRTWLAEAPAGRSLPLAAADPSDATHAAPWRGLSRTRVFGPTALFRRGARGNRWS